MAQYVLVQFSNDNEAEAFTSTMVDASHATIKVVGVWKKPTLFCECTKPSEKSIRGAKWRWWLCKNPGCGKPKRGNFQSGRNLLNPEGMRTEQIPIWLNIREPL